MAARPAPGLPSSVTLVSLGWCSNFSSGYPSLLSWTVYTPFIRSLKMMECPQSARPGLLLGTERRAQWARQDTIFQTSPVPSFSMTLCTPFIRVTCTPRNTYTLLTSARRKPSTRGSQIGTRKGQWVGVGRRIYFFKEHNSKGVERYNTCLHICIPCTTQCTYLSELICSYTYIWLEAMSIFSFLFSIPPFPLRARRKI